MKGNSFSLLIVSCSLFFFSSIQKIYGYSVATLSVDPIIQYEDPFVRIPFLILMFFVGTSVEYALFNSKLFKVTKYKLIKRSYYGLVLKINLVTFPLTQMVAYVFYVFFLSYFWWYMLFIEIVVITIEFYLYKIAFLTMEEIKILSKLILRTTIVANIISFLIGLPAFLPALIPYQIA